MAGAATARESKELVVRPSSFDICWLCLAGVRTIPFNWILSFLRELADFRSPFIEPTIHSTRNTNPH